MDDILEFLADLSANNNREWFNTNKSRYLAVRKHAEDMAERLIAGVAEFEPGAADMTPSDCMYRIYRDTRFSADKRPYKDHIGIYINPHGGKKSQLAGYYLHMQPGLVAAYGGIWCPPSQALKAIRRDIYDNVDEYLEIIGNPEFRKYFPEVGGDLLKTAPKGYPKDWEHIDLLRPRDFTVGSPIDMSCPDESGLIAAALDRFRVVKPLNDFLSYTFEEHPELPKFY